MMRTGRNSNNLEIRTLKWERLGLFERLRGTRHITGDSLEGTAWKKKVPQGRNERGIWCHNKKQDQRPGPGLDHNLV